MFRVCYNRFRQSVEREKHLSKCTWDYTGGQVRRTVWGRKEEEYIADFLLVAKRELTAQDYDIFRYRYLLGADWKLCTMKMKIDRGEYFHQVYRVEQILGRAFRETQPYALFPLDEYFNGSTEPAKPITPPPAGPRPLRPPMQRPSQSLVTELENLPKAA